MYLTYSSRRGINIWPGFVDALAALLMAIIFLLLVFAVGQFYLINALSGKEETLTKLDQQVAHLADLLALEKTISAGLREEVGELTAQLSEKSKNLELLRMDVESLTELRGQLEQEIADLASRLRESDETIRAEAALRGQLEQDVTDLVGKLRESDETIRAEAALRGQLERDVTDLTGRLQERDEAVRTEKEISARSLAQIELLNRQVGALRDQLGAVSAALGLEVDIDNENLEKLAERINVALAEKTQELTRYRSDFFGRLRDVLGENPDIRIVGDRFVLQSELLFDSGSAELGEQGKQQVMQLSRILNIVAADIPDDIEWVVRIDGHTDERAIRTEKYPSNWELSTARALTIVRFMIEQGVPPKRLAATGFGEFHPLDTNRTAEAYTKNRRIEIKLTAR